MTAKYVWLSAQGAAPVYVERALLTNGMSPHFTHAFNGDMALPPRVPALEKNDEPVYLIDVPSPILTMLLTILAHPQLKWHYSTDKSGGVESTVRRTYLRYYGLYSLKREFEDEDEAEEHAAKKARLDEDKAFDAACLALYKKLEAEHPEWRWMKKYHADFLVNYTQGYIPSDQMKINGKSEAIGWYFFSRWRGTARAFRFAEVAKGQDPNIFLVTSDNLWDHTCAIGSRKVEHWPAIARVREVDADKCEIVRVTFHKSQ